MKEGQTKQSGIDEILNFDEDDEEAGSDLIKNRSLLDIDTVPAEDRIVGLENQTTWLAKNLKKIVTSGYADNVMKWGNTGTGKTMVSRHVANQVEEKTAGTDNPVVAVYLNISGGETKTQTYRDIAVQVNKKLDDPREVPYSGISANQYRMQYLWPAIEEEFSGGLIVILDELNKHSEPNEILYNLSRAKSAEGIESPVVTIAISNDMRFKQEISGQVQSTLQPEHRMYSPYNQDDLVNILENRRDAFYDGVLEEGAIERVAELAAEEHGDARRALRLIRNAAEYADEHDSDTLSVDDVEAADEMVQIELIKEMIEETPKAGKIILFAITRLSRNNNGDWFRTSEIFEMYKLISKDVEIDPLGYSRFHEIMNTQVTTGVLESRRDDNSEGNFHEWNLQSELEPAREALISTTPKLRELLGR